MYLGKGHKESLAAAVLCGGSTEKRSETLGGTEASRDTLDDRWPRGCKWRSPVSKLDKVLVAAVMAVGITLIAVRTASAFNYFWWLWR